MIQTLQDISEIKPSLETAEPIVLCAADDNYVKPLAVMLHSAAQNLRDGGCMKAIILDGGISEPNVIGLKETLADLPIELFTIKPSLRDVESLAISHHITHTAYLRLLAGRLLPDNLDKVIYLDSDLLICDDITKLWEMPLGSDFALAVPDVACPYIDGRYADCNFGKSSPYLATISPIANWNELGLDPAAPYFNSGVMVLNIQRMRAEKIEHRLLACLQDNRRFVWCWDQYALNVVFANAWRPLPLKWNQGAHVFEYPSEEHSPLNAEEFVTVRDDPSIVHFTTEWKPWDYGNQHPRRQGYFQQLDQTAFAKWRPTKPQFKLTTAWQTFATEFVKQWVVQYRKFIGLFRSHQSVTPVDELPNSRDCKNQIPSQPRFVENESQTRRFAKQLTIFTVPKAFEGSTKVAQVNAIMSWRRMFDFTDIVLVGDEKGTAEMARELGVCHISEVRKNQFGTPLLSSVFARVNQYTRTPYLAYCNCDILLFEDFAVAVKKLIGAEQFDSFLAIGTRTNIALNERIDFSNDQELARLHEKIAAEGVLESLVCKDYFVFERNSIEEIPDFAVGRGNWDNWMVQNAKDHKIPVVALGKSVVAVHQDHDYRHAGGRLTSYATGKEARRNHALAGGRHLISGSTSDYRLQDGRLLPSRMKFMGGEFWLDFYRFAKLLASFFGR